MDLARAAVEHTLAVGEAYRQNMALRHGLERPSHIRLADTPPIAAGAAPRPAAPQQPLPVAQALPVPESVSRLPWALAGAAGIGGLVSAAVGWLAATGSAPSPPQAPQPAGDRTEIVIERPAQPDQLLGYLEERGAHLPPKGGGR